MPFLQTLGLTANESTIYELLLNLGEAPAVRVVQESKLKRPTVYHILHLLEAKDLVTHRDIHKKTHFRAEPPTKLLTYGEQKQKEFEKAFSSLQSVIPQMATAYMYSTEKPIVRVYEGVEGLKEIYMDTLAEDKPISALLQTEELDESLYEWLNTYYVAQRNKKKIHAKVILSSGVLAKKYRKEDAHSYRTTVLVSQDLFPFQHEVDIYGDKVAFIHYKKGEPLIGVVIHHAQIANTLKAWFNLAWIGATK